MGVLERRALSTEMPSSGVSDWGRGRKRLELEDSRDRELEELREDSLMPLDE